LLINIKGQRRAFFYPAILVIIVLMKEPIKQISLLILALSFNLVWANSSFDEMAFFQNHPGICNECSDTSDPAENIHLSFCEDDVFMNDSKVKSNYDLVSFLKVSFSNDFLNKVWQPPKFS
jgi:hypothetical protein